MQSLICVIVQVQFHVTSCHKLQSCRDPNISSVHYLNMEQLTKALASLFNLYDANRNYDSIYENEAEFRSFYVLLHLGPNSQPMVDLYFIGVVNPFFCFLNCSLLLGKSWNITISDPQGESLSLWFRHVPVRIINSKEMCFARKILRYYDIFQWLHLFWKFFPWLKLNCLEGSFSFLVYLININIICNDQYKFQQTERLFLFL